MSEWRDIAEYDWVEIDDSDSLHAVAHVTNDADDEWFAEGTTACGLEGTMTIPGVFSRMSIGRCPVCCDETGLPHGTGSPKNDEDCRAILGMGRS